MLAYVFWHWPNADAAHEYDELQRAFHSALSQSAPAGFVRSYAFRVDGAAPWLGGAPAYSDWYLVEDSAALDPLNVAAVSGVCEQPHASVAHAMAAGAGSLFTLHGAAAADLGHAQALTFLAKPRDLPYADFYRAVPMSGEASLWRRTMVLGPTPEFALLTHQSHNGLEKFQPLSLALNRIYP
jgi:hypothetical protein